MIVAFVLTLLQTADVPSNVVIAACDERGFALRIDAPTLGDETRGELVSQLGIGLVARGYALCTSDAPPNVILIDQLDDGSVDVLVRYATRQVHRVLAVERRDSKATGLTLAVTVEELVIVVTDPAQPAERVPTPPLPPTSPPAAQAPPRPFLRLGAELQGVTYDDTRIGFGLGARIDHEPIDRLRIGFGVAARQVDSDGVSGGSVRYRVVEAQGTVHGVLTRTEHTTLAIGAAIAGGIAHGEGRAEPGFSGGSTTRGVAIARLLFDIEACPTLTQTLALRLGAGRPIRGLSARTEAGRPLGGLTEWELSLSAAWLWSFY